MARILLLVCLLSTLIFLSIIALVVFALGGVLVAKYILKNGSSPFSEQSNAQFQDLKRNILYRFNDDTGLGPAKISLGSLISQNFSAPLSSIQHSFNHELFIHMPYIVNDYYNPSVNNKSVTQRKIVRTKQEHALQKLAVLIVRDADHEVLHIKGQTYVNNHDCDVDIQLHFDNSTSSLKIIGVATPKQGAPFDLKIDQKALYNSDPMYFNSQRNDSSISINDPQLVFSSHNLESSSYTFKKGVHIQGNLLLNQNHPLSLINSLITSKDSRKSATRNVQYAVIGQVSPNPSIVATLKAGETLNLGKYVQIINAIITITPDKTSSTKMYSFTGSAKISFPGLKVIENFAIKGSVSQAFNTTSLFTIKSET